MSRPARSLGGLPERIAVPQRLGLAQRPLAARIGVSRNAVLRYEGGRGRPLGRYAEPIATLGGLLHVAGLVAKLSRSPGAVGDLGPLRPGQDNEAVYGERLGLDFATLAALRARGVV